MAASSERGSVLIMACPLCRKDANLEARTTILKYKCNSCDTLHITAQAAEDLAKLAEADLILLRVFLLPLLRRDRDRCEEDAARSPMIIDRALLSRAASALRGRA
jgi:hypothetical protein